MRPRRHLDFRPLVSRTMRKRTSTVKPPGTPGTTSQLCPVQRRGVRKARARAGRVTARAWLDLRASRAPTLEPGSEDKQETARRDGQRPPAPRSGCFPPREQLCRPENDVSAFDRWNDAIVQSCLPCPTFLIQFFTISIFSTCCATVTVIKAAYNIPPRRCTVISLTLLPAPVKSFQMFKAGKI